VCGGGLRGRSIALPLPPGNCWCEFIAQIYGCDFAARSGGGCCLRFWFIILLYLHTAANICAAGNLNTRKKEAPMPQPQLTKLHRSRQHRMIAGVMGGIAEYFGWSPTVTRILFVIISCCSVAVPGILIYLILWILMPNATPDSYL